ncbi:hypothetical protein B0H11DRAFT_1916965 [Mycena galericulata]|nr:hypothetical protein B0H11DRAFT_1916965 [Mycena galericulata]
MTVSGPKQEISVARCKSESTQGVELGHPQFEPMVTAGFPANDELIRAVWSHFKADFNAIYLGRLLVLLAYQKRRPRPPTGYNLGHHADPGLHTFWALPGATCSAGRKLTALVLTATVRAITSVGRRHRPCARGKGTVPDLRGVAEIRCSARRELADDGNEHEQAHAHAHDALPPLGAAIIRARTCRRDSEVMLDAYLVGAPCDLRWHGCWGVHRHGPDVPISIAEVTQYMVYLLFDTRIIPTSRRWASFAKHGMICRDAVQPPHSLTAASYFLRTEQSRQATSAFDAHLPWASGILASNFSFTLLVPATPHPFAFLTAPATLYSPLLKPRPLNGLVDTGDFYLGGENSTGTPAYPAGGQAPHGYVPSKSQVASLSSPSKTFAQKFSPGCITTWSRATPPATPPRRSPLERSPSGDGYETDEGYASASSPDLPTGKKKPKARARAVLSSSPATKASSAPPAEAAAAAPHPRGPAARRIRPHDHDHQCVDEAPAPDPRKAAAHRAVRIHRVLVRRQSPLALPQELEAAGGPRCAGQPRGAVARGRAPHAPHLQLLRAQRHAPRAAEQLPRSSSGHVCRGPAPPEPHPRATPRPSRPRPPSSSPPTAVAKGAVAKAARPSRSSRPRRCARASPTPPRSCRPGATAFGPALGPVYPLSLRRSMVLDGSADHYYAARLRSSSCTSLQSLYELYDRPTGISPLQRGREAPFPVRPVLPHPLSVDANGLPQRYREANGVATTLEATMHERTGARTPHPRRAWRRSSGTARFRAIWKGSRWGRALWTGCSRSRQRGGYYEYDCDR